MEGEQKISQPDLQSNKTEQEEFEYDRENPRIDNLDLTPYSSPIARYSYGGKRNKFKVSWYNLPMEASNDLKGMISIRFLTPKSII